MKLNFIGLVSLMLLVSFTASIGYIRKIYQLDDDPCNDDFQMWEGYLFILILVGVWVLGKYSKITFTEDEKTGD